MDLRYSIFHLIKLWKKIFLEYINFFTNLDYQKSVNFCIYIIHLKRLNQTEKKFEFVLKKSNKIIKKISLFYSISKIFLITNLILISLMINSDSY